MKKPMKAIFIMGLAGLLLAALPGCTLARFWASGCGGGEADVVFVSCTDTPVGSVGLDQQNSAEVGQNADNSPMKRGESLGFEVDGYPVTVTVYAGSGGKTPLTSCVIEAEPEGGRWYVVGRDGPDGLTLEVTGTWPLDEKEE